MPEARVGDVDLYYEIEGEGPPLLLVHGTGSDGSSFDPVWPLLAAGWRVIRYDRRGYSRSRATPFGKKDYYRHHGEDAAGLLAALGIPRAAVLGWSAGGIVALALAAQAPATVGKLFLYEPPLWASRHLTAKMVLSFGKIFLNRLLGRKRQAAEAFYRMVLAEEDGTNGYDRVDEATRARMLANTAVLFAELDAGTGEELTDEDVAALRCPTALMIGGKSAPFLAAAAERLFERAPAITPLRVADASHVFLRDQPQRFVELARPYL